MRHWKERRGQISWGIIALLLILSGFLSENVVTLVIGLTLAFAATSATLTSYVESDHLVKRILEVFFIILAFCVLVYGYLVTRSFLLGVIIVFISIVLFIAFILSYLLPRIHRRPK